jgi:5-methylcytosine-specific restriction endonuclease McrA
MPPTPLPSQAARPARGLAGRTCVTLRSTETRGSEARPGPDRCLSPEGNLRLSIRGLRTGDLRAADAAPPEPLLALDRAAVAMRSASEWLVGPLARVARAFVKRKSWSPFGFARLEDHARERFARSGRWVRDLAALGEALDAMPALGAALTGDDGEVPIGRVAALVIGRTATIESVARWIALARTITVRELRDQARQARETGTAPWLPGSGLVARNGPGGNVSEDRARKGSAIAPDGPSIDAPGAGDSLACDLINRATASDLDGQAVLASDRCCRPAVPALDERSVVSCEDPGCPVDVVSDYRTAAGLDSVRGESRSAREARAIVENRPLDRTGGSHDGDQAGVGCGATAEDDETDRVLVSFPVPTAVEAALDEALELYRAISGREETVTSFVEALVAEAFAGPHPPDAVEVELKTGDSLPLAEQRMARATENWRTLARSADAGEGLARVGATLAELERISARAGTGSEADLDEQMRALIEMENRVGRELGRLLAEMAERGAWGRLLFAGTGHYAEERLRLARSTAEERAKLARALRRFPLLGRAYESGAVGLEAAVLVLRVLGREGTDEGIEQAWVTRAAEATIRRLRDEARTLGLRKVLAGAADRSGERDGAASQQPFAGREGHAAAYWPQDDVDWHASLRRSPGDFRERIGVLGRLAAASPLADRFTRLRLPKETADGLLSAIESASRTLAAHVEEVPWHEPWPDADAPGSTLAARTFSIRCRRVPSWVGFLAMIEDFARTWDDPRTSPRREADAVYIRDGWRCAAPGCTSRQNLEEHHVVYRSQGGGNQISNRICLCRFHHQEGEHGALASCRGRAPLGIIWSLGERGIGGRFQNDRAVSRPGAEAPEAFFGSVLHAS